MMEEYHAKNHIGNQPFGNSQRSRWWQRGVLRWLGSTKKRRENNESILCRGGLVAPIIFLNAQFNC